MVKKEVIVLFYLFFILLSIYSVSSEIFSLDEQRFISVSQNSNWYYIQHQKLDGKSDYIGLSKIDKGHIGLAHNNEYIGYMLLVPAFQHPVSHNWFLCPLIDTGTYSISLGSNYIDIDGSGTYTCYRYDNTSITGSVDMIVNQIKLLSNEGQIKITVNLDVTSLTPEDTGFSFIFVPINQNKFKYINNIDLIGAEQDYTVNKNLEFFGNTQKSIRHFFDWTDLPDTNKIMKVVTLGIKKGLLVGSYGYGSSQNIFIDPLYIVDYSPIPGEHLIIGNVSSYDDNQFYQSEDITSGISDDSDLTTYETYEKSAEIIPDIDNDGNVDFMLLFHFNNDSKYNESNSFAYDFSGFNNNGEIVGATYTTSKFSLKNALNFDGDDFVNVSHSDSLNITSEEMTLGAWVYPTVSADSDIIVKSGAYTLRLDKVGANLFSKGSIFSGGSEYTAISTTPINLNEWHQILMTYRNGYVYIDVNGIQEGQSTQCVFCKVTGTANDVFIGNYFTGKIDEPFVSNRSFNQSEILSLYNGTLDNGIAIKGKWNQTYDSNYDWYLRVKKTSSETSKATVYAYYNETNINESQFTTSILSGIGWFNINISSLMSYETNIGFNYTTFRFFSNESSYFSEIRLRKIKNDTVNPTITDCQINDTSLSLNETVRLKCNVTDDIDVEKVNGTINTTVYSFTKLNDWWYYDFTCLEINSYNWNLVEAWDLVGNYNLTNPNINFSCYYCTPNWNPIYEDCLINDTQFKYYNDTNECETNESLPGDNGTYVSCNYCSQNITGPFYDPEECPYTEEWIEYYIDENYDSCCDVTSLPSDCSILTTFANETINCTHLEGNIIIFADERPYLKDRIDFYATINISNATKCWSYVTSEDGKLLQTNPQRTEYSESLLFRKEEESRDYFEPVNGIVNAYYRKENLMSYQRFKLGIKCALENGTIVNGEKWVTPEYDDLRKVTARSAWGAREMSMLIITFVIVVCLIIFVVWAWKK